MRTLTFSLFIGGLLGGCRSSSPATPDLAASVDLATPDDLAMPGFFLKPIDYPSHGIFNLSWLLPEGGCDNIQVTRSLNGGMYLNLHNVTGTETSYTDVDHTDSGSFCYQLQCQPPGSGTLRPSNQQCRAQ